MEECGQPNSLQLYVNVSFRTASAGTKFIHAGVQAGAGRNSGWKILQAVKLELWKWYSQRGESPSSMTWARSAYMLCAGWMLNFTPGR